MDKLLKSENVSLFPPPYESPCNPQTPALRGLVRQPKVSAKSWSTQHLCVGCRFFLYLIIKPLQSKCVQIPAIFLTLYIFF